MPLILYGLLLPNLVCRFSPSLSKFASPILSSVMLTNSQSTQDLWFSEMSCAFLCILSLHTTHAHRLLSLPWCIQRPAVISYTHRSQVQDEINDSWVPVNMQRLRGARSAERCGQRVCDVLVCYVCKISNGGWFTKPLNWGIMALKTLMELEFVERTQAGKEEKKK